MPNGPDECSDRNRNTEDGHDEKRGAPPAAPHQSCCGHPSRIEATNSTSPSSSGRGEKPSSARALSARAQNVTPALVLMSSRKFGGKPIIGPRRGPNGDAARIIQVGIVAIGPRLPAMEET